MNRSPFRRSRGRAASSSPTRRGFLTLTTGALAIGLALAGCSKPASEDDVNNTAAVDKVDPDFIKNTFGASDPKASGQGLNINVGATLLLSGYQAFYGQLSLKGMNLAAEQIKAAGGPNFTFVTKDIAASTTAGADAVRDFHSRDIGMVLAGNIFNVGSMIEPLAQYKMFAVDPGGGTSTLFQGRDFAWGTRAVAPNDTFPPALQWVAKEMPETKKIALMNANSGEFSDKLEADFRAAAKEFGPPGADVKVISYQTTQTGGGNFTASMPALRDYKPDVIFTPFYGSDPATFMKTFATTGLKSKVIGADFEPSTTKIAGSAFNGYMFSGDYFDDDPQNDWGRNFIASYYKKYKEVPGYFPANYYESTFLLWELVKRVIAKGGNPQSGADLQAALLEDPKFASVYGDGSPTGSLAFDPKTHTLSDRPIGVFEVQDSKAKALAFGNVGGRDFALVQ